MPILHYEPKQLTDRFGQPTGKWVYTVRSEDGKLRPVGRCALPGHDAHDSPDEARECFKRRVIHDEVRFDAERLQTATACARADSGECAGPAEWIVKHGDAELFPLCDAHRNWDGILPLIEFADGGTPIRKRAGGLQ